MRTPDRFSNNPTERGIPPPWERIDEAENAQIAAQYSKLGNIEASTKTGVSDQLAIMSSDLKKEIAVNWFDNHTVPLQEKGIPTNVSEDQKVNIAIQLGAFDEGKKFQQLTPAEIATLTPDENERYQKHQDTENLQVLKTDLQKANVPIESQALVLNILNHKKLDLEAACRALPPNTDPALKLAKWQEVLQLQKLTIEVASKITGSDLNQAYLEDIENNKADLINRRLRGIDKDDHINNNLANHSDNKMLEDAFAAQWNKLSEAEKIVHGDLYIFANVQLTEMRGKIRPRVEKALTKSLGHNITDEELMALMKSGIDVEKLKTKGAWYSLRLYRNQLKLGSGKIEKLGKFTEKINEGLQVITDKAKTDATKDLGVEWDASFAQAVNDEFFVLTSAEVNGLALNVEGAINGVEGVFQNIKDRLVAEHVERTAKSEPKTAEELKAIQEKWGEDPNIDPAKFFADGFQGKGFENFGTAKPLDDVKSFTKFFQDNGINIPQGEARDYFKHSPEIYAKAKKGRKGKSMMDLLLGFFNKDWKKAAEKDKAARKAKKAATSGGTGP